MLDAKRKATKVAAQKAINIIRSQGKKRTTPTTSRQVPPDVAFDSRGKPYPVAEKLEYIRAFLLERARWKKELGKRDIGLPSPQDPEIEFTSTKRQRKTGDVTTRGARWNVGSRQVGYEDQKAFGRKNRKTGEIAKEAPQVQQTGAPGQEAERRAGFGGRMRIRRGKPDKPVLTSWMRDAYNYRAQRSKEAKRARSRGVDPKRDFAPTARDATRKGFRKRSKSGWESKPKPSKPPVGFRGPAGDDPNAPRWK